MDNYVNGHVAQKPENRRMPKKAEAPQNVGAKRLREAAKAKGILSAPELRRAMIKKRPRAKKPSVAVAHKWWAKLPESIRAEDLFWITDTLEIRGIWLLTGDGEMETRPGPMDAEQARLLTLFAKAKESQKELLRHWMKTQEENRGVGEP